MRSKARVHPPTQLRVIRSSNLSSCRAQVRPSALNPEPTHTARQPPSQPPPSSPSSSSLLVPFGVATNEPASPSEAAFRLRLRLCACLSLKRWTADACSHTIQQLCKANPLAIRRRVSRTRHTAPPRTCQTKSGRLSVVDE